MQRKLPLVTLVTPAFNQGNFLEETILSVLAQNYTNLQYIVIDDGSTDQTPAILARYVGQITSVRRDNQGQAATLNWAWERAEGDILGYLSSDDCLEPDAVSRLVDALLKNEEAMVAYGDFYLMDVDSHTFRRVLTEDFCVKRLCVDLVCLPGPGALFRRKVFESIGGWNPNLRQVPDLDYWLRASKLGVFVRVPCLLARYRIHEQSASFRKISVVRSEEIISVAHEFWKNSQENSRVHAIANAHIFAARSHAQSGRFGACLHHVGRAIVFAPSVSLKLTTWRALLSGALRRLAYQIRRSRS